MTGQLDGIRKRIGTLRRTIEAARAEAEDAPPMRPFKSPKEMLDVHTAMFGEAGYVCAKAVLDFAGVFDEPLDPLRIRVLLAPYEIGPYNRHKGYTNRPQEGGYNFILGNRHVCRDMPDGSFALHDNGRLTDFIVHEMTHHRQARLLQVSPAAQSRGAHRDRGWYGAIAEAAPRYLGVAFPPSVWPKQRRDLVLKEGRLTEVEATHWPASFRQLVAAGDPRLRPSRTRPRPVLA